MPFSALHERYFKYAYPYSIYLCHCNQLCRTAAGGVSVLPLFSSTAGTDYFSCQILVVSVECGAVHRKSCDSECSVTWRARAPPQQWYKFWSWGTTFVSNICITVQLTTKLEMLEILCRFLVQSSVDYVVDLSLRGNESGKLDSEELWDRKWNSIRGFIFFCRLPGVSFKLIECHFLHGAAWHACQNH